MNDFDFEFENLQQVQPQLRRDTLSLNVGAQAEEFERQNRGAERVQRQVEKNQEVMLKNMEIEAKNAGLKFKDMEKLANFSQTLTEKVVGYQQFKNEQKMVTGMMKAYADGYTPEEMAELKGEEAALQVAQTEANNIAAQYEESGGQPDIAQELRNMTGWEAYGYAKGMLQKAGANFSTFLTEKANQPVMTLNGKPLTLQGATNSVERDMAMRALRETYISQFAGMNPKLLNEYLYNNMKKTEAAYVSQWNADYKSRVQSENQGQALEQLRAQVEDDPNPQSFLESMDRNEAIFGGRYKTREEYAGFVEDLVDAGKMTSEQVKQLLGVAVGKNGNKINLGSWKEFDHLVQYAQDKEAERERKRYDDLVLEDKKINLDFKQFVENETASGKFDGLTLMERIDVVKQFKQYKKRPGMDDTDTMKAFVNRGDRDQEETEKVIKEYQSMGLPIPEELLYNAELKSKYGDDARVGAWAQQSAKDSEKEIASILRQALGLTDGKIDPASNPKYTRGLPIAMEEARKLFQQYRALNPGDVDQIKIKSQVLDEITKMAGKPGDFDDSPFYFKNQQFTTPKETSLNTLTNALAFLDGEIDSGNLNVIDKEFIPGTDTEYQELVKSIESGKPQIPELYYNLAKTIPGTNALDIARAQLRVRGGPEIVPTKFELVIDEMTPASQAILRNKGAYLTPQRVDRTIVTQQASSVNTPAVQELLDYVVQDESGGNYSVIYGGRTVEGLENMTIGQVIQEQHYNVNRTGGGAVGKYQMIRPEEAARAVGLDLNAKFSKENQDKMAMYYMELAGYSKFMKGQISAQSFARGLASQWAALHTAEGGSYYNDGVNKAGRSTTYQGLLERIKALAAASPFNAPQNISPSLR